MRSCPDTDIDLFVFFNFCKYLPAADLVHVLAKSFIHIGKRMATIINLTPCRLCSELYRGSFPKAGLLSLSFHHLKGNW